MTMICPSRVQLHPVPHLTQSCKVIRKDSIKLENVLSKHSILRLTRVVVHCWMRKPFFSRWRLFKLSFQSLLSFGIFIVRMKWKCKYMYVPLSYRQPIWDGQECEMSVIKHIPIRIIDDWRLETSSETVMCFALIVDSREREREATSLNAASA